MRIPALILTASLALAPVSGVLAVAKAPAKAPAKAAKKYDEAQLKALEAKLKKNPKDAKLKSEVAEASYQVGHTMMLNPELPPRVKYPGALRHFRRTLELNPKHTQAALEKKQIEDIYKSLGRPVPN